MALEQDDFEGRYAQERRQLGFSVNAADSLGLVLRRYQDAYGDPERLLRLLAELPKEANPDRAEECYWAVAAAEGHREAAVHLEQHYFARIPSYLASMNQDPAFAEDIAQDVRQTLLVGTPPKLLSYVGRGSLPGLLRVTATRKAVSALRKQRDGGADFDLEQAMGELDPERRHLKEHYRPLFRESFARAVRSLSAQERNVLRLHYLQRVTLQQLAGMYGVHRATIVRQLAATREKLLKATGRHLKDHRVIVGEDLQSIVDLLKSRFDVSVEALLRSVSDSALP